MRRAVRAHLGGQRGQLLGQVGEVLDPDGHDHLAGPQRLPVGQGELEAVAGRRHPGDQHFLEVRDQLDGGTTGRS